MRTLAAIVILLAGAACAEPRSAGEEYFRKGVDLYLKKDLAGAQNYFSKTLECRGARPEARLFLAKIRYFRGEDREFEAEIARCLKNEETMSEGLRLKSRWQMRRGENAAARETIRVLLARSVDDPVGLYLLGSVYFDEGDYEAAMAALSRASGGYLYLKQAHHKMGELYSRLGLAERARRHRAMAAAFEEWEREDR